MKVSQHKSISAEVLIPFVINSVLTKPKTQGRARALPPPLTASHNSQD